MAILCLEYKAVSIEYFMEKMEMYEVIPLMTNLHLCFREGWEMTRQTMYASLSPYMKKGQKLKDIIKFPWDDEKKANKKIDIDQDKLDKMFERAEKMRIEMENKENINQD